jgi:hypothetical protein
MTTVGNRSIGHSGEGDSDAELRARLIDEMEFVPTVAEVAVPLLTAIERLAGIGEAAEIAAVLGIERAPDEVARIATLVEDVAAMVGAAVSQHLTNPRIVANAVEVVRALAFGRQGGDVVQQYHVARGRRLVEGG